MVNVVCLYSAFSTFHEGPKPIQSCREKVDASGESLSSLETIRDVHENGTYYYHTYGKCIVKYLLVFALIATVHHE